MKVLERKVIQISCLPGFNDSSRDIAWFPTITVLCDDGTVWSKDATDKEAEWNLIKSIPQHKVDAV